MTATLQSDSVLDQHSPPMTSTGTSEKEADEKETFPPVNEGLDHPSTLEAGMAQQSDVIIVGWDGPDDTLNPKTFVTSTLCRQSELTCEWQLVKEEEMGSNSRRFLLYIHLSHRIVYDGPCSGERRRRVPHHEFGSSLHDRFHLRSCLRYAFYALGWRCI
jgi:hypothetical protein